jgi:hypothetical protein
MTFVHDDDVAGLGKAMDRSSESSVVALALRHLIDLIRDSGRAR